MPLLFVCHLQVRYVFMVYDFDESRQLNVDETILALRSTVRYMLSIHTA
jgi:hypothetical protein